MRSHTTPVPACPPVPPPVFVRTGAVILNGGWPQAQPDLECTCGAGNAAQIHIGDCPGERRWMVCEEKPATPVLVDAAGNKLISTKRRKRRKPPKGRVLADSPEHTLLMTFYFSRPVNLSLWKMIKAPKGWRKCPTSKKGQNTYRSVRFRCNNLAHSLTPDAVSELRAMLCLSLEEQF